MTSEPLPGADSLRLPALLQKLQPLLAAERHPVYLVGGAVRDALLDRPSVDLDLAVADGAVRLAFRLADRLGVPAYVLDAERDTGRIVLSDPPTTIDVARFRGPNLNTDLRDRDFTINAMALPVDMLTRAALVDPGGGVADLAAGLLRITHAGALASDPVRALRGVRLAADLGFQLTPETEAAMAAARPALSTVSPERIRDEFAKLIAGPRPVEGLRELERLDMVAAVAPELTAMVGVAQSAPHFEPVWEHTLHVLDRVLRLEAALVNGNGCFGAGERLAPWAGAVAGHLNRPVDGNVTGTLLLRLGALFHDVGKPDTAATEPDTGRIRFLGHEDNGAHLARRALRRLRFSRELIDTVGRIVTGHMRPLHLNRAEKVTRRAVFRFFRATGDAGIDVVLLGLADHLATYDGPGDESTWSGLLALSATLLRSRFERFTEVVQPPPLVDGHTLMAAVDLAPGPLVGEIMRHIQEAQAAGEVQTAEEALALARTLVNAAA